MVKFKPTL